MFFVGATAAFAIRGTFQSALDPSLERPPCIASSGIATVAAGDGHQDGCHDQNGRVYIHQAPNGQQQLANAQNKQNFALDICC